MLIRRLVPLRCIRCIHTQHKSISPLQQLHNATYYYQRRPNATEATSASWWQQLNEYISPWRRLQNAAAGIEQHERIKYQPTARKRPSSAHGGKILYLTRRLLLDPPLTTSSYSNELQEYDNYPLRNFEQILAQTRGSHYILNKLQLTPDEANQMHILPFDLLRDVHTAITYWSKEENFKGMIIDDNMNRRIQGPILCMRLLEIIGIPHHYHRSLTVHSSQIDNILECCLETNTALSRSCQVGKQSLIGHDFNGKSTAQVCEEIWRSINDVEIKYTSGMRRNLVAKNYTPANMIPLQQTMRIGRVGSIGATRSNPMIEYLSSMYNDEKEGDDGICEFIDELEGTKWHSLTPEPRIPWSTNDQRRYDRGVILFNTVLASYAKLSSSISGLRPEVRREMVQTCERLLLEVAAKKQAAEDTRKPTPTTILQYIQPDVISFNTTMKAWSSFSPKQRNRGKYYEDKSDEYIGAAAAEKTQSILGIMQDLWDEERSNRTTLQSYLAAWNEREGYHGQTQKYAPPPSSKTIAPNTSSYNSVLKALSRVSSDPETAFRALEVYQTMINRANIACFARDSLVLENSGHMHIERKESRVEHYWPDSRTFVHLLQCLQNLSWKIGFREALAIVESIYESMKLLDDQMEWSTRHNLERRNFPSSTLNKFSYNALIKTISNLPIDSYEESYECCLRIDHIVDEASKWMPLRPNAIYAWSTTGSLAGRNKEQLRVCAEKCGAHIDALLLDGGGSRNEGYLTQSINNTVSLYGKAGMVSEANDLYVRSMIRDAHNLGTLSTTIQALCSVKDINYVDRAKQHLFDYEQEHMKLGRLLPDMKYTYMYNAVIEGYLNCVDTKRGLEGADELLSHMISSHDANPRHIARPNTTSFAKVMAALSQRGNNIQRLEELLGKMEELKLRRKNVLADPNSPDAQLVANVVPNNVLYNILLKAYARSCDDENLQSAMKLLARMEADPDIKADNVSNSYVMELLSRKDTVDNIKNATSNNSPAMSKLKRLSNLNYQKQSANQQGDSSIAPFNTTMSTSTAEDAQAILDSLCEQHEAGVEGAISPNDVSFSLCINKWVKSDRPDAVEQAEHVLRRKEDFAKTFPDIKVKPSDYNSIIQCWKDHENGPERATRLFEEVLQKYGSTEEQLLQPNAGTLNALLDVYAKCSARNMGSQAELVLKRMNQLHKEDNICILPDVISYRSVIDAWIRMWHPTGPEKVEALLNEMIDKYKHEGREDLCPDSNAFNLVLKACSHAPAMYANQEAEEKGDNHPIAIANRIFPTLKRKNEYGATVTHASYSFMFNIFRQHMDFRDKRYSTLVQNLWKHCVRDGLVSKFSLDSFRNSVQEDDFWIAIGGKQRYERLGKEDFDKISVKDLPPEWSINVASKPKKEVKYNRKQRNMSTT